MKFILIAAAHALTMVQRLPSHDGPTCCYNNANSTCKGMIKVHRLYIDGRFQYIIACEDHRAV